MDYNSNCCSNFQVNYKTRKHKQTGCKHTGTCGRLTSPISDMKLRRHEKAPTVVGAVPVLVPDGRAVGMGCPGHQSFLWDHASPALVVVIHH